MAMFAYRGAEVHRSLRVGPRGVDAIAMTAGIGEHSVAMRERILRPLTWLGVHLDAAANASRRPGNQRISTPDSPVQAWIIPTDEESLIAWSHARPAECGSPGYRPIQHEGAARQERLVARAPLLRRRRRRAERASLESAQPL
ncbi:MAG: hypothetical protein U0840_28315 [Gemmataceae bacterium]